VNPSSSLARAVWTPIKVTIETAASKVAAATQRRRFFEPFALDIGFFAMFINHLSSEVLGWN